MCIGFHSFSGWDSEIKAKKKTGFESAYKLEVVLEIRICQANIAQ